MALLAGVGVCSLSVAGEKGLLLNYRRVIKIWVIKLPMGVGQGRGHMHVLKLETFYI